MRAGAGVRRAQGPFLLPARVVLLVAGLIAVALGTFTLLHDYHAGQVDRLYTILALLSGLVWLACIGLGFMGYRFGVFGAGAIAFVQFGVLASTHFVSGAGALGTFVKHEGLPVATVAMALVPACALVVMSAAVSWTNPSARNPRQETIALLLASLLGAVFVILQATDGVHRTDFGTANTEDGAFAAAIVASLWLAGGLWIGRVRRTGALLIVVATLEMALAILLEAALGFLGYSIPPPEPSWGNLLSGYEEALLRNQAYLVAFPALALVTTALSPWEPTTTSTRFRASGASRSGSRAMTRIGSVFASRSVRTREPILPVGVVTTIIACLLLWKYYSNATLSALIPLGKPVIIPP